MKSIFLTLSILLSQLGGLGGLSTITSPSSAVIPRYSYIQGAQINPPVITGLTVSFNICQSGDLAVLEISTAGGYTIPSGWSTEGSTSTTAVLTRQLTSGDISTGSVFVPFSGASGTAIVSAFVCMIGSPPIREFDSVSGMSTPQVVTTSSAVQTGDLAICFGTLVGPTEVGDISSSAGGVTHFIGGSGTSPSQIWVNWHGFGMPTNGASNFSFATVSNITPTNNYYTTVLVIG